MTLHPKDRITATQAIVIVANTIVGTGILTLPRGVVDAAGTVDAWISVLLGGLISLFAGYIIAKLGTQFPEQTFYQYSQVITGKFVGIVLNIILIAYCTLFCGYVVRILGEVVHAYVLEKTPIEVSIIAFMSVATYLTVGGINPIVRLCELFTVPIILVILFILLSNLQHFELDNLRPLLSDGFMPVLKGIKSTAFSFLGFEVMLIVIAFMKEQNKAVRSTLTGITPVILLYVMVVVITIGVFTVEEVKTLTWPTMSLAKDIEFPGAFVERLDSLIVIIWIMAIYTTFVPIHYMASLGLGQLFKKDLYYCVFGSLPAIYIAAIYPKNLNAAFKLGDFVGYLGLVVAMIIPASLWIIAKVKEGNHKKN
jgi:spore germination protein